MASKKKSTKTHRRKSSTGTGDAATRRQPIKRGRRAASETRHVQPLPPLRSDAAMVDRVAEFAELSTVPPPPEQVQRSFMAGKLKLLRTHPSLHPSNRTAIAGRFITNAPTMLAAEEPGPVPGGVGYGMFFNSAFKAGFATGTAISWEIICPTTPGGNVNDWLYITATNRSGKGVEAFVAYHGQGAFTFNIFDWARPESERWQPARPFDSLGNYIGTETVQGASCQVMALINTTYEQSPGQWVNEVRLLDVSANEWHLVYQFQYQATLQEQTGDWVGSWGPIVETFQDVYSGTSLMGALKTQILSRDSNGNWGQWGQLTAPQSDLRVDNKGFVKKFLEENYSWGVIS
jgi:hypothetical protein